MAGSVGSLGKLCQRWHGGRREELGSVPSFRCRLSGIARWWLCTRSKLIIFPASWVGTFFPISRASTAETLAFRLGRSRSSLSSLRGPGRPPHLKCPFRSMLIVPSHLCNNVLIHQSAPTIADVSKTPYILRALLSPNLLREDLEGRKGS